MASDTGLRAYFLAKIKNLNKRVILGSELIIEHTPIVGVYAALQDNSYNFAFDTIVFLY